jgi:MFS family permease
VSQVPTLAQGGYAAGIVFITPLGDMIRRRQLVLILFLLTTTVTIGLALAQNVRTLAGLSFIVGMFTVSQRVPIAL